MLLYRIIRGAPEVLLVHPGGPFWPRRDAGAWSIPKREHGHGDDRSPPQIRPRSAAANLRLAAPAMLANALHWLRSRARPRSVT
jgi:predicted NUDIX family NTP pyrophosphohydrolase